MANTSSSIEFYKSEGCPYLEEVAWRDEFLLTEGTYNHLVTIISINSISVLPTVLLNALVIFAVATRERLRNKSTILLACLAGTVGGTADTNRGRSGANIKKGDLLWSFGKSKLCIRWMPHLRDLSSSCVNNY